MNPTPAALPNTYYANPTDPSYAPYEPQYSNESTNNAGTCEAIDAEVKAINERIRHRYTNPEGEYYRDRLHKISDRRTICLATATALTLHPSPSPPPSP